MRTVGDLIKHASTGDHADVAGRVTQMAGTRTFWIGGGGAEALVLLPPSKTVQAEGVRAGEEVVVRGLVRKTTGDDDKTEGLQGADASALHRADLYIVAEEVTKR